MAQLSSPGVSVTVVDESFYTPAAPGTVPLIIVASEENKTNSAGTGTAVGTLKANAGKVYLLTSQADLGSTFGIPYFQTDASNNPVNAGELNEYGLQAAYSFLGVSNRAYVVRADLDTSQLIGTATIPHGEPADGTIWFDTADSAFGVFEWNGASASVAGGQTFTNEIVKVLNPGDTTIDLGTGMPRASFGSLGDYAMVVGADGNTTTLYLKKYNTANVPGTSNAGAWVEVGSPEWAASWPAVASTVTNPSISNAQDVTITATITGGTTLNVKTTDGTLSAAQVFTSTDGSFTVSTFSPTAIGILTATTAYTIPSGANSMFSAATTTGLASTNTGSGTGAVFTVTTIGSGAYTNSNTTITMTTPGHGYQPGDTITIQGTDLGGDSSNNLAFKIGQFDANGVLLHPVSLLGTYTITGGSNTPGSSPVTFVHTSDTADAFKINGLTIAGVNSLNGLAQAINTDLSGAGISASVQNGVLKLYSTGAAIVIEEVPSHSSWARIGFTPATYEAPQLTLSPHFKLPAYKKTAPTGSVWVKTTNVNLGANWFIKRYNATTETFVQQAVQLLPNGQSALAALDPKGGGINLALTSLYIQYNQTRSTSPLADFTIFKRVATGVTSTTSIAVTTGTLPAGTYVFTIAESVTGTATLSQTSTVTFTATSAAADATAFVEAFNSALEGSNVSATLNGANTITVTHATGGDIYLADVFNESEGPAIGTLFGNSSYVTMDPAVEYGYIVSLWAPAMVTAQSMSPRTIPADQTLWYNTVIDEVDILVNNGHSWVGYQFHGNGTSTFDSPYYDAGTDPHGPQVGATAPTHQYDGTTVLADGDLWVDTSDLENFPALNRWDVNNKKWVLVDNTDHTTDKGIIFHDARWGLTGQDTAPASIQDLLMSNFLDTDAPDPALYPTGMLLWNLRRSGFNVKKFVRNYVDQTALNVRHNNEGQTTYYPHAWVSDAANDVHGVGQFGRKAQRAVVLQALEATIQSNQQIRDTDSKQFNLISCPGYLETLSSLISLNTDRGESAFIISDAPARLTPDATTLNNWGNNVAGAAIDGDQGLIATNAYAAVYYPWGYTQDLIGNNIVVPPSHIMLRTIALSDNVSYPWFAPAGVRRGGVTNASSVGYVNSIGEFVTVALNQGQRDTLAGIHVNPITYIAGTGLVCYGQYTRQLIASSLDRINVARLVIYLRHQLNALAKPFVFEPNDTITRNEIKQQVEKLLLELTGQRALYDYLVVCDTSNNTPARIDRSELHVDIAIEPVKAVEFIYIPMRLENTGAIKGLSA